MTRRPAWAYVLLPVVIILLALYGAVAIVAFLYEQAITGWVFGRHCSDKFDTWMLGKVKK